MGPEPSRPDRVRAGHRAAAHPAADHARRGRPVELRTAVRYSREGKLWNEYVARYHYLGYTTLVGAQMRYAVHARDGTPLAVLGFSTAAWKLAARDRFIGWTRQLRERNLPRVIDNPRFLILPWVHIPNLGSHILAIVRRQLPLDWMARYHTTPVLIETKEGHLAAAPAHGLETRPQPGVEP